jgi:hypothetical protein
MNIEKINFRQPRDFSETFNVSTKFLRENFSSFSKCLLFIAGPFLLLSAISSAIYQSNYVERISVANILSGNSSDFDITYFLFLFANIAGNLALLGTTYSYIIAYKEHGPGNFTVKEVGRLVLNNAAKIIGGFIWSLFLLLLFGIVIALIVGTAYAISPVVGVLLIILMSLGSLAFLPPLLWRYSTFYLLQMDTRMEVTSAIKETKTVMQKQFWQTWLISVSAGITITIIGLILMLPEIIYEVILLVGNLQNSSGAPSFLFIIVAAVCTFFSSLTYSIIYVINAVHYYSLSERKYGLAIIERIEEIGKASTL